jgi:hypothetical protein
VPSPASAGGSADATRLAPAATTASPVPSASAAAPRASGADRPAVGAPATAVIAVLGRAPQPAASAHARAARVAPPTNARSPAPARPLLLAGAATSHAAPASSHARRMHPARSLPALRPVALTRLQPGSRGPGSAWIVAAMGLLVVLGGGCTAWKRARRICTGFTR